MKIVDRLRYIVILMVALLASQVVQAQTLRHLGLEEVRVTTDSLGLKHIESPACNGYSCSVGMPELPVYRETFWGGDSAWAVVVADSVYALSVEGDMYPVQPARVKGRTADFEPGYLYGRMPWADEERLILSRIGTMRGRVLWQLEVRPVEYDAESGSLKVHSINYYIGHTMPNASKGMNEERYEIVVPARLAPAVERLASWRRQCGYEVELINSDGLTPDTLRARLKRRNPSYVLIVGDIEDVGSFSGRHNLPGLNSHYADLYYGEYTNDYLPEALVGRLPVSDTAVLRHVVDKILRYEQLPDTAASRRALLVAGEEGRIPAPTTTNGQVNYVSQMLSAGVDTLCFRNPESNAMRSSVVSALQQDWGLVSYTSHCDIYGWSRPDVTVADIDTAYAGIWVNNCCESNRFGGNCFGEQLLRKDRGGAVAVIGAGNETLWEEDYFWSVGAKRPISLHAVADTLHEGAFDKLGHRQIRTMGEMLLAGNMAVTESGSNNDGFYWEAYCLIGDPATPIHVGEIGHTQLATHAMEAGDYSVMASGLPGERITAVQNDILLASGIVGVEGSLELALSSPLDSSAVTLTATKPYSMPTIVTQRPLVPAGAKVCLSLVGSHHDAGTDTLEFVCANKGADTARDVVARLLQTSADSCGGWVVPVADLLLGDLAPGADTLISVAVEVQPTRAKDVRMHAAAWSGNDTLLRWIAIGWEVAQPDIEITPHLIGELLPNRDARLRIMASNRSGMAVTEWPLHVMAKTYPDQQVLEFDASMSVDGGGAETLEYDMAMPNPLQGLWVEIRTPDTVLDAWWEAASGRETFEDTVHYPWQNESLHPWLADSTASHSGLWSMRSGAVEHGEHTDLRLVVSVERPDTLSFWLRTSTEPDKDRLNIFLDNQRLYYWSGVKNWTYWKTIVPQGVHTLTWRYSKDGAISMNEDCVWIDDVRLPFARWDEMCGSGEQIADTLNEDVRVIQLEMNLYPNPARGQVTLSVDDDATAEIYDMMGRLVGTIVLRKGMPAQYSTRNLRYGTYLIKISSSRGTAQERLVITR